MARRFFHNTLSYLSRRMRHDDEHPTTAAAGLARYRRIQAERYAWGGAVDSSAANPIHRWLSLPEAQAQRSEHAWRAEVERVEQRHRYPLSRETTTTPGFAGPGSAEQRLTSICVMLGECVFLFS